MADTKLTALSEISVPALEDLFYIVDDPAGTPASNKVTGYRLGGLLVPQVCQGRLTTESGVPVSTSDRTAQGTLYWTPCTPDGKATATGLVGFFDGTRYIVLSVSELSLNLATAEAGGPIDVGENYDVFLDYNAGTPALVIGAQWTNDTTRATALATQGPLVVLTGDTDWRWVGTIRASGSGTTADSGGGTTTQVGGTRYVWNAYNQLPRPLAVIDTTDNWSYTTDTVRQWDGAAGNKVEYVTGDAATLVEAVMHGVVRHAGNDTRFSKLGVGIDSTTAFSGLVAGAYDSNNAVAIGFQIGGRYLGYPGLGYHYVAALEKGANSSTFFGDDAGSDIQSGLHARILM